MAIRPQQTLSRQEETDPIGGMLEMCNHRLYRFWADLSEGLRTGQPQNETKYGCPNHFEELYSIQPR
jgi:hypothetical protein